jgi:hypothetical protein
MNVRRSIMRRCYYLRGVAFSEKDTVISLRVPINPSAAVGGLMP